jgi:2-polyprenyl-3-methyl-5-hydroxy-6-metoxy-1,4-benzoquinol methylase
MDSATAQRLAQLNREFYDVHGEAFADARPRLHPGIQRVLAQIKGGARVLEIGCGDGKVGRRLAARGIHYLGLDNSAAMLERARRLGEQWAVNSEQPTVHSSLNFLQADLLAPHWSNVLSDRHFDWILAFAVFHHLPGAQTRGEILKTLAAHLTEGGRIALSNWQFTRSERLKRRIAPWSAIGLSEADVEPNDYLLTWERKGTRGLRYVHLLDEAEARQMAADAGLAVLDIFQSDGEGGILTDYVVVKEQPSDL